MRLSGLTLPVTDPSNAARTMLWDIRKSRWDPELGRVCGVGEAALPEVLETGSPLADLDLRGWPRAPLCIGGGDQQCGALGAGVARPGAAKATFGTGTFLLAQTRGPRFDSGRRAITTRHCVPGEFAVEVPQFSAGTSLRWVRDTLYGEIAGEADAYERIAGDASQAAADRPDFAPYVGGAGAPHWSSTARGLLASLTLAHGRKEIARAVLDGVAREAAVGAGLLGSLGARGLVIDGGLTRSALFRRVFASLSPLRVSASQVTEATALGAAIIASVGSGVHRDFGRAVGEMVSPPRRVRRDLALAREMRRSAARWERWKTSALAG
jgi:sugar (pentulose or hexulose) kinase